jgi:hypothetical protein
LVFFITLVRRGRVIVLLARTIFLQRIAGLKNAQRKRPSPTGTFLLPRI